MPVFPTCHYVMGGIPTNIQGQVLANNTDVVPGLFAAGECACVSVHGSNRLGTNSLLDINVFGRRAGIAAAELRQRDRRFHRSCRTTRPPIVIELVDKLRDSTGTERVADIRTALQTTMDINAAVYRTEASLKEALNDVRLLKERYAQGRRSRTRASGTTPTCWRPSNSASCSNWPRSWWSARWSAPNPAAGTPGRTTRTGTTPTGCGTPWPTSRATELTADIRLDYKPVVQTRYQPMERKY